MKFEKHKDQFYDGVLYARVIDPILKQVRRAIADMIPTGARVVDFGCGTGALCRELAERGCKVKGYDQSSAMIQTARRSLPPNQTDNLSFECSDVLLLEPDEFKEPDYVVLSMVLHEQDLPIRINTLHLATRISHRIIIADFHTPIPGIFNSIIVNTTEFLAGKHHYNHFRIYNLHDGMDGLIRDYGLLIREERSAVRGIVKIVRTDCPASNTPLTTI